MILLIILFAAKELPGEPTHWLYAAGVEILLESAALAPLWYLLK